MTAVAWRAGKASTVAFASRAAATTATGSEPGNNAGAPAASAAYESAVCSVVAAGGTADNNASKRVRPATRQSRAPARATTSRSARVEAIGYRKPSPDQTYDVGFVSLVTTRV